MFGTYRLTLALIVALSHVHLAIDGFNPGQWAVVCFYVLSGFLMELQFHKLAPSGGVRAFYLDRFLRIYPVYFTVALLGCLMIHATWLERLINFSLLPLNFQDFFSFPLLVETAWSLACEAQFYLLVPFLACASTRTLRILLVISLTVFVGSVVLPDSVFWAYRGLPGILFTFISGMLISRRAWSTLSSIYALIATIWLIFASLKWFSIHLLTGIHINVCIGFLVAIPCMIGLTRLSPKVALDQFLGLFSYPLFLVHMIVLEFCLKYWPGDLVQKIVLLSLLTSGALVVLIEKPFDLIRYRVRKIRSPDRVSGNGPNRI